MRWFWDQVKLIYMSVFSNDFRESYVRKPKQISKNTIRQPSEYAQVGVLGLIGFSLGSLIFLLFQKEVISCLVILLFTIPYIFIILFVKNWKIEFDETGFSFTNIWARKKDYSYDEVKLVNTGKAVRVFYKNRKIVAISPWQSNTNEFEKQYNNYVKSKR